MSSAPRGEDQVPFEVITFGRSGVDIYPPRSASGWRTSRPSASTSAAPRPTSPSPPPGSGAGPRSSPGSGDDPFGRFVRRALRDLGVDDRFVVTSPEYATPVTFCEIFPPDDFPLYFYRKPTAPDMQVRPEDIDFDAVRGTALMWLSVTGLSEEPSRESHFAVLEARARKPFTVLDLDYRPMFWADAEAAREQVQRALPHVTVAVGNREECEVAIGESDPERAADALLAAGVELAVVKQGPKGVLAKTRTERVESPPDPDQAAERAGGRRRLRRLAVPRPAVRLAAGEGAAATPTRPGRSSPPGWSAPPPCRPLAEIETLLAGGDPNERRWPTRWRSTSPAARVAR